MNRIMSNDSPPSVAGPLLSVIIPAYGNPEVLQMTLDHLVRQTLSPPCFEIIVVDDGSPEPLSERLSLWKGPPCVDLIRQENAGVSAARNLAVSRARGEICLLLNQDILCPSDLLQAHLNWHQLHRDEWEAVQGAILWSPLLVETPFMQWVGSRGFQFSFSGLESGRGTLDYRWFYACNSSLKRIVLLRHPFRPDFVYGFEDTELGFRMSRAGLRLYYDASLVAYHHHPMDFHYHRRRAERSGRTLAMWKQKYPFPAYGLIPRTNRFKTLAYSGLVRIPVLGRAAFVQQRYWKWTLRSIFASSFRKALGSVRCMEGEMKCRDPKPDEGIPRVAVLIVTHNGLQWLENCISSLLSQSYPRLEVAVLDNASTDGTADWVASRFPGIDLVRSRRNLGFARGNNILIRRAMDLRMDYMLLMNQDVRLDRNTVSTLVEYAEHHPQIGILSPLQLQYDSDEYDPVLLRFLSENEAFLKDRSQGTLMLSYAVQNIVGAAMLVRRNVFRDVGLFDEAFFCYGEEIDFVRRARLAGWGIEVLTAASVHHYHRAIQVQQDSFGTAFNRYRGKMLLRLKTPDSGYGRNILWFLGLIARPKREVRMKVPYTPFRVLEADRASVGVKIAVKLSLLPRLWKIGLRRREDLDRLCQAQGPWG